MDVSRFFVVLVENEVYLASMYQCVKTCCETMQISNKWCLTSM